MENKAFIFTIDAALALIPVFIILTGLSQVSYSGSLFSQSFMLGGERVSNDVLRVLDLKGVLNETNSTAMNETLVKLIPSEYNFRYRLVYNDTFLLCNASRGDISGNLSNVPDITSAERIANVKIYDLLSAVLGISQFGSEISTPCCQTGSGASSRKVYNGSFYVNPGDKSLFTYWLVGERQSGTAAADTRYGLTPAETVSCICTGSFPMDHTDDPDFTQEITDLITEGATNEIFIWVPGNQVVNFWIIRAPIDPIQTEITPENAQFYFRAIAKLEVWLR